jgi:hypothetical protein
MNQRRHSEETTKRNHEIGWDIRRPSSLNRSTTADGRSRRSPDVTQRSLKRTAGSEEISAIQHSSPTNVCGWSGRAECSGAALFYPKEFSTWVINQPCLLVIAPPPSSPHPDSPFPLNYYLFPSDLGSPTPVLDPGQVYRQHHRLSCVCTLLLLLLAFRINHISSAVSLLSGSHLFFYCLL